MSDLTPLSVLTQSQSSIHRQTLTLLTFVLEESAADSELAAEAEDLSMTCRSNLAACHFQASS